MGRARQGARIATNDPFDSGLARALRALARHVQGAGIRSLALPRLATGVGALDWADVKPLIQQHLGGLGIPVFLYEVYRRDRKADERLR